MIVAKLHEMILMLSFYLAGENAIFSDARKVCLKTSLVYLDSLYSQRRKAGDWLNKTKILCQFLMLVRKWHLCVCLRFQKNVFYLKKSQFVIQNKCTT